MVEQVRVQELTTQEQKQDCGCGCGGSLCGTTQQELVLVDSARLAELRQRAVSSICGCDASCGCGAE